MDYETFLNNYTFYVAHETEQIPLIININEINDLYMFKSRRKDLSLEELHTTIRAELMAFHIYDSFVRKKETYEFTDAIMNAYGELGCKFITHLPAIYKAKEILKNHYEVNIYELPFRSQNIKLEIKKYDLLQQLERYFKDNNIDYKSDDVFIKGQELSKLDSNIKLIIDEINDIDMDLKDLEGKEINI